MLTVVEPDALAYIPGSPAAFTQTLTNGAPRLIVHDATSLTFASPWASSPLNADLVFTLTYDPVLSRVRISATGMEVFTTAKVERSTDQVRWTTVRGGEDLEVFAGMIRVDDYEFSPNVVNYYRLSTLAPFGQSEIGSITPMLDSPWLKSVARPFLNQPIEFGGDQLPIQRPPRGGVFDIVGRSLPVAVTDVRGSKRYTVVLRTETDQQADNLDLILASGDVLFTHGSQCRVPSGVYWYVGMVDELEPIPEDEWQLTTAEVVEVAAPGPDIVGATSTCQTVLNLYATCADVLAAFATCADLLELVGDPSEVIVP